MGTQTFLLPDLGEGLTEAEIISWAVAVGDTVAVDQVVVTVETAKAQVEVPCPYAGVVAQLYGDAGAVLDVGTPLISVTTAASAGAGDSAGGGGGADQASALVPSGTPESERDPRVTEAVTEERGGSGNVLIGYGTSEAKRGRRRRVVAARAEETPGQAAHAASQREFAFGAASPAGSGPAAGTPTMGGRVSAEGTAPGSRPGDAVRVISPLVRKMAAEHGIDLRRVRPSAPGGIITKRDVEAAIATAPAPGPALSTGDRSSTSTFGAMAPKAQVTNGRGLVEERIPITGIRKVITDKLTQSRREIPDATTWVDVDATGLRQLKDDLAATVPEARIGYLALLARIVVAGLTRYPAVNARVDLDAGEIVRLGSIHLSFAADSPRGLVVPVVHHAEQLTTTELAAALRDLVERARAGTLTPAELTGGTFTLNNYGVYGVDGSTPIINHPEAGMLGVGRIVDKPWVVGGALAVRPVTQLSLTFDHRVCDGGVAGGFIRYVADCVERPGALLAGL
ncbi:MAG: 2-oxo acid dehydrogenase subunit E2 [Austwickia sp.]|jgi:2-oxoisovalerate dehydrogenase E2 component (dihydrolipoyl transacylase)|nr:MAG: 2-oxo acid dehydrogenase subunit E2 [Austwickia sp.]